MHTHTHSLQDNMDSWTFSSSSPSAHIHHPSPLSSPPPVSSVSAFKLHEDPRHAQVTSNHLPGLQEAFPQLCHPQKTPHLPSPQMSSPLPCHSQVTPPHLHHSQVTAPHLHYSLSTTPQFPHPHVTSPQLSHTHVTSPQLPHPHVTSPQLSHTHVTSPQLAHPHVTSPQLSHTHVTSPQLPHPHVTSPQLSHTHVTSPQLPHPHVTSPQLAHPHVTSPQLSHTHVTSPQLPHPHVTSPQLSHTHVTSPQLPHPIVTSHQLPHPQLNSLHLASPSYQYVSQSYSQCQGPGLYLPYSHVSSPDFGPQPQVTSPNLVPPCQISPLPSPQHPFPSQNPNADLDHSSWNRSQPSGFANSYSYSYQIQTTAHLDFNLQNQNENQKDLEPDITHRRACNTHTLVDSRLYSKVDTCGPVQDTWEPLEPVLSRMQCSPPGSISGGATVGRWNSVEFSSSSAEDFSNTQFFPDSYHDNDASQSFCSPITPDPHYPPTQTISSPGPQMHPRKERLGVHSHSNTAQPLRSCLHKSTSCSVTSDPSLHQPHETSSCLIAMKTEPMQDQVCFSPQGRGQDVHDATQSPGLSARLNWKGECGGRGRKVRGGGNGQAGWAWMKRSQRESSTEAPGYRLPCTVCKRDFRSLPALNGHMRSHSGVRAASCLKKSKDSSPSARPSASMVLPVSVPVQTRASKMCRSRQRSCSQPAPNSPGPVLFQSLMRLKGEEEVISIEDAHYTPPPMLCPHRLGPGLYCSLTRQQSHSSLMSSDELKEPVAITTRINRPRINVGLGFQAQLPSLRDQKQARGDSHDALLLWTPWDELEAPANQERVEAFVTMARSSVMPGGGVSPEHALHVLSQSRGDFLLTVEKLLSTPRASNQHTGWSAAERRQLVKSLQQHHKDFSSIQRDIQTKSLPQCVEFYYLWKKKLSLRVKIPVGLTITLPSTEQTSV